MALLNKMKCILELALEMEYYKNYAAASGAVHNISCHEDAVEDLLLLHGLSDQCRDRRIAVKQREEWLKDPGSCDLPDNTYIAQPCGTHNSPDFIVKLNGRAYFIECKSSKQAYPTYNSGLPKDSYIYIFCSKKYNATTIYFGRDIVSEEQRVIIDKHLPHLDALVDKLNDALCAVDANYRGLSLYPRAMWNQKGGRRYTDYFNHPKRHECEQGVLNAV
jgi:hypothetical protein